MKNTQCQPSCSHHHSPPQSPHTHTSTHYLNLCSFKNTKWSSTGLEGIAFGLALSATWQDVTARPTKKSKGKLCQACP